MSSQALDGINAPPFEVRETRILQVFAQSQRTCSQLHIDREPVLANAYAPRSSFTNYLA